MADIIGRASRLLFRVREVDFLVMPLALVAAIVAYGASGGVGAFLLGLVRTLATKPQAALGGLFLVGTFGTGLTIGAVFALRKGEATGFLRELAIFSALILQVFLGVAAALWALVTAEMALLDRAGPGSTGLWSSTAPTWWLQLQIVLANFFLWRAFLTLVIARMSRRSFSSLFYDPGDTPRVAAILGALGAIAAVVVARVLGGNALDAIMDGWIVGGLVAGIATMLSERGMQPIVA